MGVRINAHRSHPCRESSKLRHWSCTIRIVATALSRRGKNPLKWIWIGPLEYVSFIHDAILGSVQEHENRPQLTRSPVPNMTFQTIPFRVERMHVRVSILTRLIALRVRQRVRRVDRDLP